MSHMNLNLGIIAYEDASTTSPKIKSLDYSASFTGVMISGEKTNRVENIAPGETVTLATTARTLTQDNTTVYAIEHPLSQEDSIVRLKYVSGATPGFATKRAIGTDATSIITISRVNSVTSRIKCVGGTMMSTAAVVVGDILKIEKSTDSFLSLFAAQSQGAFTVLSKGADYIDVNDNGLMATDTGIVLGSSFDFQLRVFSLGPVKINDVLEIMGVGQNPNNMGKYPIYDISHDYVQIVNPYAVDLSFTNTSNIQVYSGLMGFLFIRASDQISIKVNEGSPTKITRFGNGQAIFIGSVNAFKVELVNEGTEPVSVSAFYSSVVM
jgi:DNA-directed RNA polymerase subunit L